MIAKVYSIKGNDEYVPSFISVTGDCSRHNNTAIVMLKTKSIKKKQRREIAKEIQIFTKRIEKILAK